LPRGSRSLVVATTYSVTASEATTRESGRRAGPESLMLALSVVYLVILLIVVIINLGGHL
jgi:hypothetical protein